MTDLHTLSVAQLHQVVAIKEKIEALQSELDAIVSGAAPSTEEPAPANGRRKRHMSAASRARIAAAQQRRWAKVRAAKGEEAEAPAKKKRRISPAMRARLAALVKARWAKAKASGKSKL